MHISPIIRASSAGARAATACIASCHSMSLLLPRWRWRLATVQSCAIRMAKLGMATAPPSVRPFYGIRSTRRVASWKPHNSSALWGPASIIDHRQIPLMIMMIPRPRFSLSCCVCGRGGCCCKLLACPCKPRECLKIHRR